MPNPAEMTPKTPLTIKICGLSTREALDAALDAGAGMVGFNFFPPSPRYVAPADARPLADRAKGRVGVVALAVDPDDAMVDVIVAAIMPDVIQLHGRETPERVAAVRDRTGVPVMKAMPIGDAADLAAAARYASAADMLLLDARPPKGALLPGGNGVAFDWRILEGFAAPMPYLLGGGLSPTNVADAIAVSGAPGVDVSSGVESAPGKKEPDLIRAFIAAARRAEHARLPETASL